MDNILTDQEAKFCLLYVDAPAPLCGDARECYKRAFNEYDGAKAMQEAKKLLQKEAVQQRIKELDDYNVYNAASLRPKITETLIKIMDEMADAQFEDKDGRPISTAAARSVSVNAAKELNDMYGIKEDITHKVQLEGSEGQGITFNIVVPNKPATPNDSEI